MTQISSGWSFFVGLFCMLVALALETITLAAQRYAPTLLTALLLTILADVCLGLAAWKGGIGWRLALTVMLPTLFIILDCLRRAAYAF